MRKNSLALIAMLVAMCGLMPLNVSAFSTSAFASSSRLASGQWVKIAVSGSGIYEITADELIEMGFSQPEKVAVYGQGGYPISEVLNGNSPDDLQPVGALWHDGKLFFYAKGVVQLNLTSVSPVGTTFNRTRNSYSQLGYYFLTQEDNPVRVSTRSNALPASYTPLTSSLSCWFHENEMASVSNSGKDLLGEDMLTNSVSIPYRLDKICNKNIGIGARAACATTGNTYLVGYLCYDGKEQDVNFSVSDGKFEAVTNKEWFYDVIMPYSSRTLTSLNEEGELKLLINHVVSSSSTEAAPTVAKVDYALISYNRLNAFADDEQGSFDMWYSSLKYSDVIQLTDVDADVMVWDVGTSNVPVSYTTQLVGESTLLTLARNMTDAHLTVFSPSRAQMKINSFERVPNQNLHSLTTPDMLIVTCGPLIEQAKRVAQLHMEHDGMTVEVVDQEQVFNEFSSGTPDAMAIRLLCKMLYDRDPAKFKNLLLFGTGAFDNRGIVQHKENTVITYESDNSHDKVSSYPCDDFYGMLEDGSGQSLEFDRLCLGVGRIPSANVQEAKTDVDKLVSYVLNPDYGVWRNNYLLMADEGIIAPQGSSPGDIGLHVWQAEGVNLLINDNADAMHSNKVYVETFARDANETSIAMNKRTSTDARKHIIESLNAGQYFMSYIGHAGGSVMAGNSKLWRSSDVLSNNYSHLPIMSTACCNVARYDSDSRGIAEVMFHYPKGGVIALLTPARDVYSNCNDMLNRSFVSGMFSFNNDGSMTTLGEAYRKAKLSYARVTDFSYNKMSYFLMGDPAIKINFPRSLATITKIAGQATTDTITLAPMQQVTVEAEVNVPNDKVVDDSFTGNATITLYGSSKYYTSYTKQSSETGWNEKRDIMLERPLLAQVESRVVNGHITAQFVMPRHELDEGALQLCVYAHKDGTDQMVNGVYNKLKLGDYDPEVALTDTQSPVISSMYLNDAESFASNNTVSVNSTLYITASDDIGINMLKNSPGQDMRLTLDNNKEIYYTIKDYAVCTDDGRTLSIAFPLSGLKLGQHSLTFTVFDLDGNSTSQTINFIVGLLDDIALDVIETPVSTQATFDLAQNKLSSMPQVDIRVTDAQGNLVWKTTTTQFPVVWDLKNTQGQRVPAGLYKFFGTYRSGNNYGGTEINDMIVINPLQ